MRASRLQGQGNQLLVHQQCGFPVPLCPCQLPSPHRPAQSWLYPTRCTLLRLQLLGPMAAMHSSSRLCCQSVGNHRGSNAFTTTSLNTLQCQPVQTPYQPLPLALLPQEWPGHARASASSLKEKGQRWVLIFDICKKSILSMIFCRTWKTNLCYVSLPTNFHFIIHEDQLSEIPLFIYFFFN